MRTAAALGLLVAVGAVLFFPVLFQGRILLPGDYLAHFEPWRTDSPPVAQWNALMWDALAQFYPWRLYLHRSIRAGTFPLWNPHQFCGAPFLANLQSAVLYPPNLVFVLIHPARALGISAFLHLVFAAAGTFLLARRLGVGCAGAALAGLCFGYSSFLVCWAELPTVICTVSWLPWLLIAVDRIFKRPSAGRVAILALGVTMCLLAGHLQMAFYCAMAAVLWTVRSVLFYRHSRKAVVGLTALIGSVLLAGMLSAAQMLPTAELAGLSARATERSPEVFAGKMATLLQPAKVIVVFSPRFFGSPSDLNYIGVWNYAEHTMYVGVLALLLALVGALAPARSYARVPQARWFFVILAALSLALASSRILNAVVYFGLPGYSSFGSPARILCLWCFAAAMLAGMGLQYLSSPDAGRKRHIVLGISAAVLIAAWAVCGSLARGALPRGCAGVGTWQLPATILVPGLIILLLILARAVSREMGLGLVLLLAAADLLAANWGYNPTCRMDRVYPGADLTDRLRKVARFERIVPVNNRWSMYAFPEAVLPPNSAMVYGLYDAQGYDSLFPGAYKAWLRDAIGEDPSPPENGNMVFIKRPEPQALKLGRYVVGFPLAKARGPARAGFFAQPGVHRASLTDGSARVVRSEGGETVVRVSTPKPAVLTLRDAHYPGWRAYLDDKPIGFSSFGPVHMACRVPAGNHEIRFSYEPASFRNGLRLSLVGLAIIVVMLGSAAVKRRARA